jgi:MFS transporter, BCD family, chlorophyll transporter
MAFSETPLDPIPEISQLQPRPLSIWTMLRLGLFQMGLGIMSVLTLGILNRVMINELAIPATVAAGAIAMHQFVSPARLWFGQLSDHRSIKGYHRTGYIWIGSVSFVLAAFLAVQVMWQLGTSLQTSGWSSSTYAWAGLMGLIFALYGIALSASSTPYAALLVDISNEQERSKLVGVAWSLLMVGIVIGAVLSARLLPQPVNGTCQNLGVADLALLKTAVNRLFILMPGLVLGLGLFATAGIEKKYSHFRRRNASSSSETANPVVREDQITIGRALRVLTASRQTGLFFSFLLLMTLSLFMQDAVMESYGGKVFGMCVSATTRLNAFWGTGTLMGISTAGFLIVPRLGKQKTARLGCGLVAFTMLFVIGSGFTGNPLLLQLGLLVFGLASGITTTGAISLMLDLTAVQTAGTFIGAWGLAQAMARAFSTVIGGAILDLGRSLFDNLVLAYALVFTVQAVGMLTAVWLLNRVNVKEFQTDAQAAMGQVFSEEIS